MALTFFSLIKHFCIIALMSFTFCNSHMCPQSALSISAQCTLNGDGWNQEVCHNNYIAIMWRRHLFQKTWIYENWNMDFAQLWQGFSSFVTSYIGVVLCGPACAVTCVFLLLTPPTLIFPFESGPLQIEWHNINMSSDFWGPTYSQTFWYLTRYLRHVEKYKSVWLEIKTTGYF